MTYELDINVLAGLEPISSFKPAQLFELLEYCNVEVIPKGGNPFKEHGLLGQSVYLMDGELELNYQDGNKVVLSARHELAKHPIGKRQPNIVSATALRESQLLRVDDDLLDRMVTFDQFAKQGLAGDPRAADKVKNHTEAATSVRHLLSFNMFSADSLKSGPLAQLPMANISALLQRIEAVTVREGDVIIREGGEGDYYYLIDNGRALVTRLVDGVDVPIAELKAGDVFGEEALISDAKRNATITMKSNGVLLRLGREDFLALLKEPLLHKINYGNAVQAIEQGAVWLDVRYPTEYRFDSLRGAMNVPLNDIRNAIGVLDRSRKYIAYCQSGRRSAVAAFIMAQAGYDVQVLDGGLWSVPRSVQ